MKPIKLILRFYISKKKFILNFTFILKLICYYFNQNLHTLSLSSSFQLKYFQHYQKSLNFHMFWLLQNHSIRIYDFLEVSTYKVSAPQAFLGILHLIPSQSPLYSWIIFFFIIFSLFHMPKIGVTTKVSWFWEESLQRNVIFPTFVGHAS